MAWLPKVNALRWLRNAVDIASSAVDTPQIPGTVRKALVRVVRRGQLRDINEAIEEHQQVYVTYQKDNGEVIKRTTNPYEVKPHHSSGRMMVYLTDDLDGPNQIKSYAVSGFRKAEPLEEDFEPVEWEEDHERVRNE